MFKPPQSIIQTMRDEMPVTVPSVTAAEQAYGSAMYAQDPIVDTIRKPENNLFTPDSALFTTLANSGISPTMNSSPFIPLNDDGTIFGKPFEVLAREEFEPSDSTNEVFQRKMERFTGLEKDRYFSQKEAVENSLDLLSPQPVLNSARVNPEERINFYKEGLLRQANVSPVPSQYVGAKHIHPIFKPAPPIGAERTVNPKTALSYNTNTPAVSKVANSAVGSEVFKNKVYRTFPMSRMGYTTTGAVVAQADYGEAENKNTFRPETANLPLFRNPDNFNSTPLSTKRDMTYTVNTDKEQVLNPHTGQANAFNSANLRQQRYAEYNVNTDKESVLDPHIGQAGALNTANVRAQRSAD